MLPTDLENIVGHYVYGEGHYNLTDELDFALANRGMIPDCFLSRSLPLCGYKDRMWGGLSYYMVLNPLRTDSPFHPWALIDPDAVVFDATLTFWMERIQPWTFRGLKTYHKTFKRHVHELFHTKKNCERQWNFFVGRYLQGDALLKSDAYRDREYEDLFRATREQLKCCGYLSPKISLPPRVSRQSVLSQAF